MSEITIELESEKPEHSPIGASSYYRWSKCPGSVNFCKTLPSHQSIYAKEGTEAHDIASQLLMKGWIPKDIPEEMKDSVLTYVNAVLEEVNLTQSPKIFIEHRFDLSELYEGLYGTCDAIVWNEKDKKLTVFDFKNGAGIPVEVEENPQLMYYGLGALLSLDLPCDEIELVIVQPRCLHPDGVVRRWKTTPLRLAEFSLELVDSARRTSEPNPPLVPGSHCRFCRGAAICPAIHEKALKVAKEQFSFVQNYDPEKLSETLSWLPAIEGWAKQVREFAYRESLHGRVPPGYKLVQKRKVRRWKNESDVRQSLIELGFTDDEIFSKSLKSPAQMEKVVSRELKEELDSLIVAESSGFNLAPENDAREPIKLDAKTEFTPV